ncbi:uncharacterized protein B0T15DRAFT_534222 [Chaetomium strumarium]|uniref:Uncharacterized protein n=1 Tax=Chaetomium strumarium TaxID=1170767 RepID=A0AAJ0M208_9PEZI|nr:hypothetical protein B0T15DRAFT_534222 [Chaetomium strumarium]
MLLAMSAGLSPFLRLATGSARLSLGNMSVPPVGESVLLAALMPFIMLFAMVAGLSASLHRAMGWARLGFGMAPVWVSATWRVCCASCWTTLVSSFGRVCVGFPFAGLEGIVRWVGCLEDG